MPGVHPFAPGRYHAPGVTPPPTPKGEPFYFSPGVMKYDSAGKTGTWQGQLAPEGCIAARTLWASDTARWFARVACPQ